MADLIISAAGLGICVAGIAYLILKGGGENRKEDSIRSSTKDGADRKK